MAIFMAQINTSLYLFFGLKNHKSKERTILELRLFVGKVTKEIGVY